MKYSWLFILPIFALITIVSYSLYRFYTKQRQSKKAVMLAHSKKIRSLPEYEKARIRYRILLVFLILCFSISLLTTTLAASRPISVSVVDPDYETRDIMLCVDVSASTDNNREDLLLHLSDVVSELKGQRIGVTIFATKAALLSPLTNDYSALSEIFSNLRDSFDFVADGRRVSYYIYAVGGTSNIGDGVASCVNNFDNLQAQGHSRSLIIATDNMQTEGSITIEKAVNYAKRYGISVYGIDTTYMNTGDNLTTTSKDYKRAISNAGGIYYSLGATKLSSDSVVDDILTQESMKYASERKYVQADSPELAMMVAAVSVTLFMIVVWRMKL